MNRDFNRWLSNFKSSISNYSYYVDFDKVYRNVDKYKVELNILNALIGSKNIEKEFENILLQYPNILSCIPILLAVRSMEIEITDEARNFKFGFKSKVCSIDEYKKFMRRSGLFDLLENHIINNLFDYAMGIEVGLDSNGRKNRGGHLMENLVETYIKKAGFKEYYKEMNLKEIEKKWGLDLSTMSGNNVSTKRFDFVIKTKEQVYVIETNFYSSSGSKLNETARSYKMLANEAKQVKGLTFIWITDGLGWIDAKRNLEETFNEMDTIYNIDDLENNVLEKLK